ncbi:hypothetical protein SAMN04487983_103619 [Streptomyces sp. yr375]|uniref:hypothetical protein n=1 Tax=Streptomyces sp. yr375 TaxID=1761906 RepID=UPI0008D623B8|nr:hypothetical protein [Streptomyces sp. yr375]SES20517.1 hypothetical protein SAMN04487983_103619 [Streptomyces sp. yr375]
MLLLSALLELVAYCAGLTVQAKLGALGVMLMFTLAVAVRARHKLLTTLVGIILVVLMLRPGA